MTTLTAPTDPKSADPALRGHTLDNVTVDEKAPATFIHVPVLDPEPAGFRHGLGTNSFLDDKKPAPTEAFSCEVEVAPGAVLKGYALGPHLFIDTDKKGYSRKFQRWAPGIGSGATPTEPLFKAEVTGPARTRTLSVSRPATGLYRAVTATIKADVVDGYTDMGAETFDNRAGEGAEIIPFVFLPVRITAPGAAPVNAEFCFHQPETGQATLDADGPKVTVETNFLGITRKWTESLLNYTSVEVLKDSYWGGTHRHTQTVQHDGLEVLFRHVKTLDPATADLWWARYFEVNTLFYAPVFAQTGGLTAALKRKTLKPVIEALQKNHPLDWTFFTWLQGEATSEKAKNNGLLTVFLLKMEGDSEGLLAALKAARAYVPNARAPRGYGYDTERHGPHFESRRAACLSLPGASDKVAEAEAKADWTKRKGAAAQAEGLGIDPALFPKLFAAIEAGDIPTSVFHQPNKTPVNVEFPLWERALNREGWAKPIYEVAQDASRRSTYEKDITPWINFMFRIEKYLEKHTGKPWKAIPKYVESQWELEMSDEEATGTTKRRSAFTPVADNDADTITVPYVAVAVSGIRTQWCYARHYYIFEEGFTDPESGGIVYKDFEEKLNGRDDYGLCYYDLIGTSTATGYPTFLIIFERLARGTRVHFHRVRPQRSKNGIKTPACQLIEACYQYMAGNIPAKEITAQQGDLIFIQHPNDPIAAGAKVKDAPQIAARISFESHSFEPHVGGEKVSLFESTAKTPGNRLGFLQVPAGGLSVKHPEHDHIGNLGEGWFEVRRSKSFEASPVGIWSLTID